MRIFSLIVAKANDRSRLRAGANGYRENCSLILCRTRYLSWFTYHDCAESLADLIVHSFGWDS